MLEKNIEQTQSITFLIKEALSKRENALLRLSEISEDRIKKLKQFNLITPMHLKKTFLESKNKDRLSGDSTGLFQAI